MHRILLLALLSLLLVSPALGQAISEENPIPVSGTPVYSNQYYRVYFGDFGNQYYVIVSSINSNDRMALLAMFEGYPKTYSSGNVFVIEGDGYLFKDLGSIRKLSTGHIKFEFQGPYIKYTTECVPYNGLNFWITSYQDSLVWVYDGSNYMSKKPGFYYWKRAAPVAVGVIARFSNGATIGGVSPFVSGTTTIYYRAIQGSNLFKINNPFDSKNSSVTGWLVFDSSSANKLYLKEIYNKTKEQSQTKPLPEPEISQPSSLPIAALIVIALLVLLLVAYKKGK